MYRLSLFAISIILLISCGSEQDQQQSADDLFHHNIESGDYTVWIDAGSEKLAQPVEIIRAGEAGIAVMDYGFNRILLFDDEGNPIREIGGTGSGPGEWSQMSGAGNLIYQEGRFIASDRERFRFDLFEEEGDYIRSVDFPQYMTYRSKAGVGGYRLLTATQGRGDALAVILDLDRDGEVVKRIGTPEADAPEGLIIEEDRQMLASGEVPPHMKNNALVEVYEDGYVLFMYSAGEIRNYTHEGDLRWSSAMPESLTDPVFDFVSERNKESAPYTVFRLQYAFDMRVNDEQIYLLTTKFPDTELSDQYLLRYNMNGALTAKIRLEPNKEESMYVQVLPLEGNDALLIDYSHAEIVRITLPEER